MIALRFAAIAIAGVGVIDPVFTVERREPLPVRVHLPPESHADYPAAVEQSSRVRELLASSTAVDSADTARAQIVFGTAPLPQDLSHPVFIVRPSAGTPAVDIAEVSSRETRAGQSIPVTVRIRAEQARDRTTVVSLRSHGVVLDQVQHRWTSDGLQTLSLSTVALDSGVRRLQVTAETSGLPTRTVDVGVVVRDGPFRILVHEARPSWTAAFIRRALEADPLFSVLSVARTSRETATRSPRAPASLAVFDPDDVDAIVLGAPDEMTDSELAVTAQFVERRGGTVLLAPDRPMASRVTRRFALPGMQQVLLERPQDVTAGPMSLQASELLVADAAAGTPVATVAEAGGPRAAVLSRPLGEGTVIVSGLLDAWRYRAAADATAFWRAVLAEAAAIAPSPLSLTLEPSLVRPGELVHVRAAWRADQLVQDDGRVYVRPVAAFITGPDGAREMIRLWPGGRAGQFEGTFAAGAAGSYTVRVQGDGGESAAPVAVAANVTFAAGTNARASNHAASASGGALITDPQELSSRLAAVDRPTRAVPVHPMRSPWWGLAFAACLCAEWWVRRRRGER